MPGLYFENVLSAGDVKFYAILTEAADLPQDSIVIYDQVQLNEGSGYDSVTGTFTAVSAGIYHSISFLCSTTQVCIPVNVKTSPKQT